MPDDTFDIFFQEGLPLGPVIQGYTFEQDILCYNDEGYLMPKDLSAYTSLVIAAKEQRGAVTPFLYSAGSSPNCTAAAVTNPLNGILHIIRISISAAQSASLPAEIEGVYEIKGIRATGQHDLLFPGPFRVEKSVVPPT